MDENKKDPKAPPASVNFEGTMVDLGEDLLEKSRTRISSEGRPDEAGSSPSIDDELQHADILMGERLFDDAKKILRRVLRRDPANAKATVALETIQKLEIQDLLGSESPRNRLGERAEPPEKVEDVIARLERDLGVAIERSTENLVSSLFPSPNDLKRYADDIVRTVTKLSPRQRIDVGVAYLEMGLPDVAKNVFESVVRYEEYRLTGTYLFCVALIRSGKPLEATLKLEPLVRDITLSDSDKTDFLYLMGTAFEALSDMQKAREFYRRVYALNPRYRDVVDKLK